MPCHINIKFKLAESSWRGIINVVFIDYGAETEKTDGDKFMKTKAVRLYNESDLRLEEFELPEITDHEILARVVSDSLCMSTYKCSNLGSKHKRVPNNIGEHPVIIGHEFCSEIVKVGSKCPKDYKQGQKFAIQPALNDTHYAAGYSFEFCGGDATYIIIPKEYIDAGALLKYETEGYFYGSLAEPFSCVIGAFNANYHTRKGEYILDMGIVEGGKMALLAAAGPMGLAAINYIMHGDRKPSLLVVTDIDQDRLDKASKRISVEEAKDNGVELIYLNTGEVLDPTHALLELSSNKGFNDVFVFAPVLSVIEQADDILAYDGCLNFFAGPTNENFKAPLNFYNIHYNAAHVCGTVGGNTNDMKTALKMMESGKIDAALLITHIGGLDSVAQATLNLPKIPGGKKLIYTNISLELTAIEEFASKSGTLYKTLAEICDRHNGLWSVEAENYLLENAKKI